MLGIAAAGYASRVDVSRRLRGTGMLLVTALLVAGCAFGPPNDVEGGAPPNLPSPTATSVNDGPPSVIVSVITQGLSVPWGIAFLPDGSALVTERDTRRILKVSHDGATVTPVQTINEAQPSGEGGLLGIAVSPDYVHDGLVFIYYTTADDNRIAKLTLGGTAEPIVTGIPKASARNGGQLAFGPDGYLYASTGDGAIPSRAQDLGSLSGKILRMTEDGTPAPGNPFPGSLVWTYGHRDVQGMAWDSTGRMFATEFGQDWDEINRIQPGRNYGWPVVDGQAGDPSYVDPIQQWPTDEASCSGMAVAGDILVAACLRGARVWLMRLGADGTITGPPVAALVGQFGRLRAAATAPDGSIWVSTSNKDGSGTAGEGDDKLLRLVAAGGDGSLVLA
jgi:glucose/arabinose dehydrogenase